MKISYIQHSGFAIELPEVNLIFDYFTDPAQIVPGIVGNGKPTRFFVSHRHPDHYSTRIFGFSGQPDDIRFILSSDIRKSLLKKPAPATACLSLIRNGEVYTDGLIKATALPSTDTGISLCVESCGQTIFHAGDLNLWHWKDESSEREIKMAEGSFRAALKQIRKAGFSRFNIAMFPVDSRQGSGYEEGARIFVHEFQVDDFFPMHFWDAPEKATDFSRYKNPSYGKYHGLTIPGQSLIIP